MSSFTKVKGGYGKLENNTIVTYYYTRKTATLLVRHLDYETNDELAREEISTVRYGDEYETGTKDIRYYIYNSVSGVPSAIVDSDYIEVINHETIKAHRLMMSLARRNPALQTFFSEVPS